MRDLLREEGVSFQAVRSWKRSNDPNFEAKKNRILELYELADAGQATVICLDEFGPLNLQPQSGGKAWAPLKKQGGSAPPTPARTAFATCSAPTTSPATASTATSRSARAGSSSWPSAATSALYPAEVRLHFVLDNFSPHHGEQVREWAREHNVELAYTPHYGSWLNRIEAQLKAQRYFTLDGTDHPDHATQARLIRRYIGWRNHNVEDTRLRALVNTANVA